MNIRIVCVGKLRKKYLKGGIAKYVKRMGRSVKVKVIQVPDEEAPEKLSPVKMEQIKETEGKGILNKIRDKEYVYVAAIKGKKRTSGDFTKELADLATYEHSDITFVIGGSLGASNAVNKQADDLISFDRLTIPHQLM